LAANSGHGLSPAWRQCPLLPQRPSQGGTKRLILTSSRWMSRPWNGRNDCLARTCRRWSVSRRRSPKFHTFIVPALACMTVKICDFDKASPKVHRFQRRREHPLRIGLRWSSQIGGKAALDDDIVWRFLPKPRVWRRARLRPVFGARAAHRCASLRRRLDGLRPSA
jgi:hypothetical protein